MEAVVLLLQLMFLFSSFWFGLSLFKAFSHAPWRLTGAYTHEGPVFVRMPGWWITEPVIFSGSSVAAIAAFLLSVSV